MTVTLSTAKYSGNELRASNDKGPCCLYCMALFGDQAKKGP